MTTKKNLVKPMLMSTLTVVAFTFGFTACTDEIDFTAEASQLEPSMGTRAESSTYNINYHNVIFGGDKQAAKPFDTKNWEKESAIFCYVGKGGDESIYDSTRTVRIPGFEHVNLPWSDDATSSNIPEKIWKEVNPNPDSPPLYNPWKLVLMNCGKQNVPDGNFLGFYNELSGILRIFVYVPRDVDAKGGTHMWGVKMNDVLASRSIFRYGVPMRNSITSSGSKQKLNQSDDMSQVISPWKEGNFVGFSNSALNPGWWAFDVDLSLYRDKDKEKTIANLDSRSNALTVQALSRTDSELEMKSQLFAKMQGSLDLKATQVNTESGIFAPYGDVLGKANEMKDLFNLVKNIANPNPLEALQTGIKFAKGACNLVGIDYGETKEGFNGYKGSLNLTMDGTIDTKGVITSPDNVSGFNPVSLKHDNFLMDNCKTFGEGIWNLEEAPVVYYSDMMVQWRFEYKLYEYDDTLIVKNNKPQYVRAANRKSPFNAQKKWDYLKGFNETSKDPWCGYVCFFDPSSIKVKLNPNIFTQAEIDSAKVYATCGVRKANSTFGSIENYRLAQGLKDSRRDVDMTNGYRYVNRCFDEAPFNALTQMKDKMGMDKMQKFPISKFDGHNCGVFGRGDDEYLLEPTPLSGDDHPLMCYMPNYEVTVTVVVNHNGTPIAYSRTYLPEYVMATLNNLKSLHAKIASNRPENYERTIYTQQANRIKDILTWAYRTLLPVKGSPSSGKDTGSFIQGPIFDNPAEAWTCLVDGTEDTKWCTMNYCVYPEGYSPEHDPVTKKYMKSYVESAYRPGKPAWICEFKTLFPMDVNPTGYTLVTANDNSSYHNRRPRVWLLLGKKNESDKWTLLAEEDPGSTPNKNSLPTTNKTHVKYMFNKTMPQNYQFFRFEVLSNWEDCWDDDDKSIMQLAELYFNYD